MCRKVSNLSWSDEVVGVCGWGFVLSFSINFYDKLKSRGHLGWGRVYRGGPDRQGSGRGGEVAEGGVRTPVSVSVVTEFPSFSSPSHHSPPVEVCFLVRLGNQGTGLLLRWLN